MGLDSSNQNVFMTYCDLDHLKNITEYVFFFLSFFLPALEVSLVTCNFVTESREEKGKKRGREGLLAEDR